MIFSVFFRIEKPLSTVQTPQGRAGGRVPTNRSRGEAHDARTRCTKLISVINHKLDRYFLDWNRCVCWSGIREGALTSLVLSVHVGKWHLNASSTANAQHWGASGVSGPHSEDGGHQVRPSNHMGGQCKPSKLCNIFAYVFTKQNAWIKIYLNEYLWDSINQNKTMFLYVKFKFVVELLC